MQELFTETDWKLFKNKIGIWQNAYMEKLNREYIDLLSADGTASEMFWALDERIKKDRKSVGVVADMRRSQMIPNIISLLSDGVIREEDLSDFSETLQSAIKLIMKER